MSCDDPGHAQLHAELVRMRDIWAARERQVMQFARVVQAVARTRPHDGSQLDEDLEGLLLDSKRMLGE